MTEAETGTGRPVSLSAGYCTPCCMDLACPRCTQRAPRSRASTVAILCRHRERDDKKRNRDDDRAYRDGGKKERKDGDAVSVDETNRMRAELGLKPLK